MAYEVYCILILVQGYELYYVLPRFNTTVFLPDSTRIVHFWLYSMLCCDLGKDLESLPHLLQPQAKEEGKKCCCYFSAPQMLCVCVQVPKEWFLFVLVLLVLT